MQRPEWAPDAIDITTPSIARSYDYLLGGSHNFAVDRQYVERVLAAMADARLVAQANRAFMNRAVRFMVGAGTRQFLDIGSGIPTVGNVDEIAQDIAPDSRVVYVDAEPVAVAHSEQILAGNDNATVILEDLRHPEAILNHPQTRGLLDFGQPVGLLLVAILHAILDRDDPAGLVRQLCAALPDGSYVAISHGTADSRPVAAGTVARLSQTTNTPVTMRDLDTVRHFFSGLSLVDPGVVWAPLWRPESPQQPSPPEQSSVYVGVGRKA